MQHNTFYETILLCLDVNFLLEQSFMNKGWCFDVLCYKISLKLDENLNILLDNLLSFKTKLAIICKNLTEIYQTFI